MSVLTRNLGVVQANDLSISIIASSLAIPLNLLLTGQLGAERSYIHLTLIESRALPKDPKPPEGCCEPRKSERDTESDEYGENGERMPYYPARPSIAR
jgi:hypothetical protein